MTAVILTFVMLLDGTPQESRKNIFGGHDYKTPQGEVESYPNVFGGMDYHYPNGRKVRCRPNPVTKGEDCKDL